MAVPSRAAAFVRPALDVMTPASDDVVNGCFELKHARGANVDSSGMT
ncbi:MAG: hypothetical protein ACRYHQ_04720 [Janthinobacterium lividum]